MNKIIDALHKVKANSGKSNLFRFAILWAEGGWYTDWKSECLEINILKKLQDFSNNSLVTCRDEGNDYSVKHKLFQTAFVGAPKRDPCIGKVLSSMVDHVRKRYYGINPFDTTGPGVWGRVVRDSCFVKVKCTYMKNHYIWNNKSIIRHKCERCTKGQDWKYGNNYNTLWKRKTYYI